MTQQYTLVLPIKIHAYTHDELRRFIHIQLRSLNKFLDIPSVYEFLIICKTDELAIIQKALAEHPSPLPIRLITENTIVKEPIIQNTKGWYLQQLLKLGVAKIIKTPLYLVLDTDCFLTKRLAYQDLFYEGKILLDKESWTAHPDWWIDSIKIIDGIPFAKVTSQLVIGMTPQIFVTDIVLELLDYINQKEQSLNWDEYLSTRRFTEFSLYWLFLLKTNRTNLYSLCGCGPCLLGNFVWNVPWHWRKSYTSLAKRIQAVFSKKFRKEKKEALWKMEQTKHLIAQIIKADFENNDYFHFSLIQSNLRQISLDWIIEETNKYLS